MELCVGTLLHRHAQQMALYVLAFSSLGLLNLQQLNKAAAQDD